MSSGKNGDVGSDVGGLALATCALVAVALLVPIGLATLGFAAIMGLFSGLSVAPRVASPAWSGPISATAGAELPREQLDLTSRNQGLAVWSDRPAINQFDRRNYQSDQSWAIWRNASCSAAALAWLLRAYHDQLGTIDDAIALIGSGTGLSPSLGLLDARGPALARALAARGLHPRVPGQRPLGSVAELKAWLNQGPLLMDGARWFGQGHWFVGIGYDAGGIHIRDSSGWDTRYLSWSRLYGEVGFSGWVVGVTSRGR
jgi:hypothetical protein